MGVPQYLCRLTPQSFNRYVVVRLPKPPFSAARAIFSCASRQASPLHSPESTRTRPFLPRIRQRHLPLLHRRSNHPLDRQSILGRELKIPLIMRRHAHNRARPIVRQDVVAHPNRNPVSIKWIHRKSPVATPFFSIAPRFPAAFAAFCSSIIPSTATCKASSEAANEVTNRCSGANCTEVAPKIVSTRVVNTVIFASSEP